MKIKLHSYKFNPDLSEQDKLRISAALEYCRKYRIHLDYEYIYPILCFENGKTVYICAETFESLKVEIFFDNQVVIQELIN